MRNGVYTCVYVKWMMKTTERERHSERNSLVILVEQNAVRDMKQTNAVNLHKQYKIKCNRFSLCCFSAFWHWIEAGWCRSSVFDCDRSNASKGKGTSCELESMWTFLLSANWMWFLINLNFFLITFCFVNRCDAAASHFRLFFYLKVFFCIRFDS